MHEYGLCLGCCVMYKFLTAHEYVCLGCCVMYKFLLTAHEYVIELEYREFDISRTEYSTEWLHAELGHVFKII
jgi:hypothetical protein